MWSLRASRFGGAQYGPWDGMSPVELWLGLLLLLMEVGRVLPGSLWRSFSSCGHYSKLNKFKPNPEKTEEQVVGPDLALGSGCDLILDELVLPRKERVHSVGILLYPALLDKQVAMVAGVHFTSCSWYASVALSWLIGTWPLLCLLWWHWGLIIVTYTTWGHLGDVMETSTHVEYSCTYVDGSQYRWSCDTHVMGVTLATQQFLCPKMHLQSKAASSTRVCMRGSWCHRQTLTPSSVYACLKHARWVW